ncbi:MFS transporter, partial [Chloroflexota bacterium]
MTFLRNRKRGDFFYGYVVVIAASGLYATIFGILTMFGVFYKPLLVEFGWTRATMAGAYTLYSILSGFLGIAMGGLTDKFGPRVIVMTLGSFLGLGILLMSQVSTLWQIYLFWGIMVAIGKSTATAPLTATVARWFTRRRALMTGIVTSGGAGLGGMALTPLAAWLILTYGWRSSYFITGITAIVFILILGHFLKRDPAQLGQLPEGAIRVEASSRNQESSSVSDKGFMLRQAIVTRQFWAVGIMFFSYGFLRGTIFVHIVAYVTDLGYSLIDGSYVLAVITGASAISGIIAGRMADKTGNKPILMISYIIIAVTLLAPMVVRDLWVIYMFAIAFSLGRGGAEVVRYPLTSKLFGLSSIGVILGFMELMTTIGTAVGPLLG